MLDLSRRSLDVAPLLLGAHLTVRDDAGAVTVRLTEVEAYDGGNDPGSHAYRGLTPRTEVMFGPPGRLYVYFTYGMHWCANVVCGDDGRASAVLLRAGEVVDGVELARSRRPAARKDVDLARGPARMAQALGLAGPDNGVVLEAGGRAELVAPATPAAEVAAGPRVGVSGPGGDGETFPWRFWLPGEPTVSAYRPGVRRRRRPTDGGPGR
ncbi:DNA-3-methyladenine glycosylase [Georgenia satyanarayanai]|uniref:DNA-3-methyladenine glycosylase n=1 Tax=Georgenia satyanarayanai TaxID=860221 RepID=UPI001264E74F|nr:DNA-3-methyladenine glycosylase [Georgenia satyanarayanai]